MNSANDPTTVESTTVGYVGNKGVDRNLESVLAAVDQGRSRGAKEVYVWVRYRTTLT